MFFNNAEKQLKRLKLLCLKLTIQSNFAQTNHKNLQL